MPTSIKRRLFLIISVLCLVTMGGGGYLSARALASRHVYRTVPVTRGSLASAVSATGTLNAVITVQVGSQGSGQIKELHADFNSQVKKGQVIAKIDPRPFKVKVDAAQAVLAKLAGLPATDVASAWKLIAAEVPALGVEGLASYGAMPKPKKLTKVKQLGHNYWGSVAPTPA